jgi:hypothetical protein
LLATDALGLILLRLAFSGLVLVVIEQVSNRLVNVKHHNVENTISIDLRCLTAEGMIGNKDKPMIRRDRSEGVSTAIKAFAEIAVAVEVVQLLKEGLVGELLVARKVEILPAVTHPINLEAQKLSKLDQNGNASKQRSSSASLKHHHVRIDKERRLREHISIQVLVGDAREDGAACAATNLVQVTTRQATKANPFARKHRSGRFASNLAKEDLKVLLRAFKDARVCIMKITASVGCCENGAELT